MTVQIVTIVTPYYVNRPNRLFSQGVCNSILELGNAIRSTCNGGSNSITNIDHSMIVNYCGSEPRYDNVHGKAPAPSEDILLRAKAIATSIFNGFSYWEKDKQDLALRAVFSIYGYGTRKADKVFVFRNASGNKHSNDEMLYRSVILVAKAAEVPIKYFNSK